MDNNNFNNSEFENNNGSMNASFENNNGSMNAPFENTNDSMNQSFDFGQPAGNFDQANDNSGEFAYTQGTEVNGNGESYEYAQGFDEASQGKPVKDKQGTASLIIGIVMNALNIAMLCCSLMGGGFIFGGLLIILPIYGISAGVNATKNGNKGIGIAGIILNSVAVLGSAIFIILGIIGKIAEIAG